MQLEITASAAQQINKICAGKQIVRLSITSGGCQGFNKNWEITQQQESDDQVWEFDSGKLVIDPVSLDIITGATIDYKTNLGGSYFTVDIPAATSTCGCGTSFSL
jgi:iron-sulfur cluster assembly accessory protein